MAAGKTLESTIELSGILSPSLLKTFDKAVDELNKLSDETLESADAATRLLAEMDAQEDILKTLQRAYAGFAAQGEESSEEAQTLAKRIQTVSDELGDNKATLEAAERATKQLTAAQDDGGDAFAKLEKKINSQESELSALRREYANVALSQGESSAEARQLESRISSLSGELKDNKQKLKAAEDAAEQLGDALEEAGEKAENSSDGYTILKDVISDLAADAISAAIEGFKELALEGDTALGMLEAKTGATGEKMKGFEDVMYEVYNANYGENLGDVSEKLSTVIQMTDDLDNASLAKVTKQAIALEDVFGFDVNESMRAANSLMDQFGITSDEAFNLVVQGAQNGLNQNDDLLDTINEYSVQFKNAGYSADDMFNMLANGVDSGTWSVDKLGDAVKEFNIRASDGTITDAITENAKAFGLTKREAKALGDQVEGGSVEAYQKLLDKLKNVDDDAQRYQLGVAMFGTMWEDLGENAVFALMDTEGAISKTSDAMEKMDAAAYDTLESSLSQLGRTIKAEVIQPIAEKLIPVAKSAVDFVTSKVGPAVDWLLNHLPEVGIAVSAVAAIITALKWGDIVAKITQIIGAIKGVIAALAGIAAPVWIVVGVIAVLAAAFTNLWRNNEDFRNKITAIWDGIKAKFEAFGQGIVDRLNALGFDFSSFSEVIGAIWDGFCNLLAPVFEGAFATIGNVLGLALDTLTGLFDIFAGIFTGDWEMVWEGVKGIFGGVWDFIVNQFTAVTGMLKGIADTVLGWFGTNWETVWGSIMTFFVNTWNGIASFFSGIWTKITGFCSTAWNTIKNAVQVGVMLVGSILKGAFNIITLPFRFIWENCKDTVLSVWNKIKSAVSKAINAVKSVIIPVVTAIRSFMTTAWNAISSKVSAAVNKVKTNVSTVWNGIKSITSSVWNGIKSAISTVWTAISSRVRSAINTVKSTVSGVWNSIKSVTSSVWNGIKNAIVTPIETAKNKIKGIIDRIKGFFSGMKLSLPKIKLPHFSVEGKLSLNPPSVPKLKIDWYKEGGIMTQPTVFGASGNTLLAGGEAGAEAILPLSTLWDKLESVLRSILNADTGASPDAGLTSKAGELLTLDNFSLGSLADGTSVVIYYDFSGFTWSPQIHADGAGNDENDVLARLKAHEAEFFDWLEEFIQMREVATFA